jgi:hypothetical protein
MQTVSSKLVQALTPFPAGLAVMLSVYRAAVKTVTDP